MQNLVSVDMVEKVHKIGSLAAGAVLYDAMKEFEVCTSSLPLQIAYACMVQSLELGILLWSILLCAC